MIYFSLQIYGVNSNTYYNPIISFVEKEQAIKFITVRSIENLYKEIENSDKAVMVDLYADWCVACKEFEKYTFSDIRVSNILNELKLIKFDITETTEEHSMYLKEMRIFGPPALIFYDRNGNEIMDARIVGYMESDSFLKVLNLVKR